jgi:cytochrome c
MHTGKSTLAAVLTAVSLGGAGTTHADPAPADNPAMIALATHGGCLTCHSVQSHPAVADGSTKPVGPAWQDVAAKYKDRKDARRSLIVTVMNGSNPYASHWKGKVSGLAMPPNAVAITRGQARELVNWILTLDN